MKCFIKLGFVMLVVMAFVFMGCKHETEEPIRELEVLEFIGTPYTELPAGTDGTIGTSGRYVLFGDWPQTIKADNVFVDEYKVSYVGMFTYYKGSDGAWYAKIKENAYGSTYKYSNGSKVSQDSANSYKYFKVEPIKWRILMDLYGNLDFIYGGGLNKLLFAENILVNCQFYDYEVDRGGAVYPNNYRESRIRAYLNGLSYNVKSSADAAQTVNDDFKDKGFLQTAFTEAIRSKIATNTVISNNERSTNPYENAYEWKTGSNIYHCEKTNDIVFLLSQQEISSEPFGFAACKAKGIGNTRIRMPSDFAKASGVLDSNTAGYGGYWWLRSPSCHAGFAARIVHENGFAYDCITSVYSTCAGVCPAVTIKN